MRRLHARFAPVSSGRLGSPSGPTTWLCRSRLDAVWMKAAKAVRIRDDQLSRPPPEVRSLRQKPPQWSAARRCAFGPTSPRTRCRKRNDTRCASRRSMPLVVCRGETKSSPRAMKRESECVCVNGSGCLKIESEAEDAKQKRPACAGRFVKSQKKTGQTAAVIHCCNLAFGAAPT